MDTISSPSRIRQWTRIVTRAAVLVLAAIGLCWLVGGPMLRLLLAPAYDRQITKRVYSPNSAAVSEIEVTKGGLGTVWTTSVYLRPVGQDGWTVYQTRDSDFTPSIKWKGNDTLVVGLRASDSIICLTLTIGRVASRPSLGSRFASYTFGTATISPAAPYNVQFNASSWTETTSKDGRFPPVLFLVLLIRQ